MAERDSTTEKLCPACQVVREQSPREVVWKALFRGWALAQALKEMSAGAEPLSSFVVEEMAQIIDQSCREISECLDSAWAQDKGGAPDGARHGAPDGAPPPAHSD